MSKYQEAKDGFGQIGVNEGHIDYAMSAIKEGTRRELIVENLVGQRGLAVSTSDDLLNQLYQLQGGEFKIENRGGYIMGIFSILAALGLAGFAIFLFYNKNKMALAVALSFGSVALIVNGIRILIAAFRGKYRDDMDPFKDEN